MSGPRPGDSCSLRSVAAPVGGMWAVLVGAGGKRGGGARACGRDGQCWRKRGESKLICNDKRLVC